MNYYLIKIIITLIHVLSTYLNIQLYIIFSKILGVRKRGEKNNSDQERLQGRSRFDGIQSEQSLDIESG